MIRLAVTILIYSISFFIICKSLLNCIDTCYSIASNEDDKQNDIVHTKKMIDTLYS